MLVNDHRPYLALGGLALGAGSLFRRQPHRAGWILKAGLGLVLIALCWQRAEDWRSEVSLWEAAVREGPGVAAAHHNLAFACHQEDRTELARQHYERAVALAPDYTRPPDEPGCSVPGCRTAATGGDGPAASGAL